MTRQSNDPLNALFEGDTGPARTASRTDYRTAEQAFTEGCPKCRGTGHWRPGYPCFKCKGKGKLTFKTSPAARAQARVRGAEARAEARRDVAAMAANWQAEHPTEWAWMTDAASRDFRFAAAMVSALNQYGELTQNQFETVSRLTREAAERKAARAAEAQARSATADTAGIDRLKAAFDHAIEWSRSRGRERNPKITLGGVTISPAKATSKNPGALYVKNGQTYLGKIAGGRFMATRECDEDTKARVLSFVADPEAAARVYGQEFNRCCICNRTLTAEESMSRFMGPICAERFGWGA